MAESKITTIWYPSKRVIRTAVQVLVSIAAALAIVVAVAPQVLTALESVLPSSWVAWLTGAIAFVTALSAALARVMAIPAVDAFLTKLGAGSTPATTPATSLTGDGSTGTADTSDPEVAINGVIPDPDSTSGS